MGRIFVFSNTSILPLIHANLCMLLDVHEFGGNGNCKCQAMNSVLDSEADSAGLVWNVGSKTNSYQRPL